MNQSQDFKVMQDQPVAMQTGPTEQLIQLAIVAGRKLQSSQTGFVHYHYRPVDEEHFDAAPLYENFLFALALLRSPIPEAIQEGTSLLKKLLAFQIQAEEQAGSFPLYIHEYPACRDEVAQIRLAPIFFFLLQKIAGHLHGPLRHQVEEATFKLITFLEKIDASRLPIGLGMQWAASFILLGKHFDQKEWSAKGEETLEQLHKLAEQTDHPLYFQPKQIADLLVALQMLYPNIQESPWRFFWTQISSSWHVTLASYVGPHLYAMQEGDEPEVTLYDLYMGYFARYYSRRALLFRPVHLQAALIQSSLETLETPQLPFEKMGTVEGRSWLMWQHPSYACAMIQKKEEDVAGHGYIPFVLYWGDLNAAHSLICSGQGPQTVDWMPIDGGVALICRLPEEVPGEAKQRNRELSFFLDQTDATRIEIGVEKRATVFQIGELISLSGQHFPIQLRFGIQEGDGRFFGHVHPSNRPGQTGARAKDRFTLFDRQIFLRTLHRQPSCTLYACITWQV